MTIPAKQDFFLYEGDTDKLEFTLLEGDGTPCDLSRSDIVFEAKRGLLDVEPTLALAAVFPDDPTIGQFTLNIPAGRTSGMTDGKEAFLHYDLQHSVSGEVTTLTYGWLRILPEVTTAWRFRK